MQKLINDLLQFSRLSTRGAPFEICDMNSILRRSLDSLSLLIQEKGAQINYYILPNVNGDPSQLAIICQNLINNSLKFCDKEKPIINISVTEEPDHWHFSFSDNGIGIDQEYHVPGGDPFFFRSEHLWLP